MVGAPVCRMCYLYPCAPSCPCTPVGLQGPVFGNYQTFPTIPLLSNARDKPLKHFLPAELSSPEHLFAPGLGDVKVEMLEEDARSVAIGLLSPQLTAFFTRAPILASSAAVNSFSAKAVGHMAPSSRSAWCMKPNVAYLVLNFCALWKKQTTLPSLAYAGIPYQSLGERAGALALMIAWSRSPRTRSASGILAIVASTALSQCH
jgi:hypothetical protein